MIPNALTASGAHADLWCHLKAMDHALERALQCTNKEQLDPLDTENLSALAEFLKRAASNHSEADVESIVNAVSHDKEPTYSPDIDIRSHLRALPEFQGWLATSKTSFDRKVNRLFEALENYIRDSGNALFAQQGLQTEFEILRGALTNMLRETQAAMQLA